MNVVIDPLVHPELDWFHSVYPDFDPIPFPDVDQCWYELTLGTLE